MIILDVNKVSKDFGQGALFEDLSFSLNDGESLSIVGSNGCGKSTLLKMIAGLVRVDSGNINKRKGAKIAYLDQTGSSISDNRKVEEILRDAFSDLVEMENRLNQLQEELALDSNNETIMNKYCNLLEKFSEAGGYDIDYKIDSVVAGLNIDRDMLNKSYNDLSGGEKTLVQLAKALLIQPDLFLLDEPTNHLDIARIEWLESYIKNFKGAIVIVSHDRYFLDKVSNRILDLDGLEPKMYYTNYSGYLVEKAAYLEKQLSDFKTQQKVIKRLQERIKYFSELGMQKNSSTLCDRAKALQTQLDRILENKIELPKQPRKLDFGFGEERKTSKRVIEVQNLNISLPSGKKILENVNLIIGSKERVAVVGANGSGKSTFIKTIMGEQTLPVTGDVYVGPSVKIGYLPQIITFPDDNQQILDYFKGEVGIDERKARQVLAGFNFYKDDVVKRVKNLSGGEKIRLKLAELLQKKINTLIFDEPTNHIDIPTKEVLENAISDFDGTLIFISHDRYFINKFADRTIEFENSHVYSYLGGYDDYKEEKLKRANLKKKYNDQKKKGLDDELQL